MSKKELYRKILKGRNRVFSRKKARKQRRRLRNNWKLLAIVI